MIKTRFLNKIKESENGHQKIDWVERYMPQSEFGNTEESLNILENFKHTFPGNDTEKLINETQYLISLKNLFIEKSLDVLKNNISESNNITDKMYISGFSDTYRSKLQTNFNIFQKIYSFLELPQNELNENYRNLSKNLKDFYFKNEENILLMNLLQECIFNPSKIQLEFQFDKIANIILEFITLTNRNMTRNDLINECKKLGNSPLVNNLQRLLENFSQRSLKIENQTSNNTSNVYSFIKKIDEDSYLFVTERKLYSYNVKTDKIKNIDDIHKINENAYLFELNQFAKSKICADGFYRIEINEGSDLLEFTWNPTYGYVSKFKGNLITEDFTTFVSKLSRFNRVNNPRMIINLYENLPNYKDLTFATKIESKDRVRTAHIFLVNENINLELDDFIRKESYFFDKVNAVELKNTIFEHTGLDISSSIKNILNEDRKAIKKIEEQRDKLKEEIKNINEQIEKVIFNIANDLIDDNMLDDIKKLQEDLEIEVDNKKELLNSLNLKIDVFENQNLNDKNIDTLMKHEYKRGQRPFASRNEFVPTYAIPDYFGKDINKTEFMYAVQSNDKVRIINDPEDPEKDEYGIVSFVKTMGEGSFVVLKTNGRQATFTPKDIGVCVEILDSNTGINAKPSATKAVITIKEHSEESAEPTPNKNKSGNNVVEPKPSDGDNDKDDIAKVDKNIIELHEGDKIDVLKLNQIATVVSINTSNDEVLVNLTNGSNLKLKLSDREKTWTNISSNYMTSSVEESFEDSKEVPWNKQEFEQIRKWANNFEYAPGKTIYDLTSPLNWEQVCYSYKLSPEEIQRYEYQFNLLNGKYRIGKDKNFEYGTYTLQDTDLLYVKKIGTSEMLHWEIN